jgi:hypothetical protein
VQSLKIEGSALSCRSSVDLMLRRSIAIAANQPFSGWDQIFPDKAMTVAAIDRLVHHATILEMNGESFRQRAAASNKRAQAEAPATTISDTQNEGET